MSTTVRDLIKSKPAWFVYGGLAGFATTQWNLLSLVLGWF